MTAENKRIKVGVIFGGRSGEHEVSLASAASVFAHLDRKRYEPVPIRIEVVRAAIMPSRLNTSGPATSPARTAS